MILSYKSAISVALVAVFLITCNKAVAQNNYSGARQRARQRQSQAVTNRIGPDWMKGQDGAQNVKRLKHGMKQHEYRQVHQYEQAMMQVREQQQQEYDRAMLEKLGSQRPVIQQNRQDIRRVRQETGANTN